MGTLRPQAAIVLKALRNESRLRRKARNIQAFHNVYYYPVVLTADPERLDGNYLSRCFLKAATLKKHDLELWAAYTRRAEAIAPQLTAENLAFIFYSYGRSKYPSSIKAIRCLLPYVLKHMPNFSSQELSCIIWSLATLRLRELPIALRVAEETVRRSDQIRPIDCVKIFNSVASLGVKRCAITDALSSMVVEKMDLLSSQNIRYTVHPTALCELHTPPAQRYILHRVARVRSVLRPYHLRAMYRCAIALRVIHPIVYDNFLPAVKRYLTRLATTKIPWDQHFPSEFHWDVSAALVQLGIHHKTMVLWGCFWIHLCELKRKQHCWMVDPPAAFYAESLEYRATIKLQHRILWHLGWEIRRIAWADWVHLDTLEKKVEYLRQKNEGIPAKERLTGVPLRQGQTLESCWTLLEQRNNAYKKQRQRRRRGPPTYIFC